MSDKAQTKERRRPTKGALVKRVILVFAIWAAFGLAVRVAISVFAAEPATSSFDQTWTRTDDPVASGLVDRTWMWGEEGNTNAMSEPYSEAPGGERTVQYFDKSRMEDNSFRASAPWDVTNGLLVVELITGRMQVGDEDFVQHDPAEVNVAGDQDVVGVQYATLADLLDAPAVSDGATITQRLDLDGGVTDDPSLVSYGVTAAYRVTVPGIDHQVASPFWAFMNSNGTVNENGAYIDAPMFLSAFYATGYPITEAYWANVKVAGTYQDVLMQCFERRCLTYTPGNAAGWKVEAGNVGQHYYEWRYGQVGGDEPTATEGPSPTATATEPIDGTPPAEPTASPTATEPDDEPIVTPTHEPYVLIDHWGGPFDPDTAFDDPSAVAIGSGDVVYITEYGSNRVQKFTASGEFLQSWDGNGRIDAPEAVAVDRSGYVYVSNYGTNEVLKFDWNGTYITTIGSGLFDGPCGIAFDSSNRVYVADYGNNRILKFASNGAHLGELGTSGSGPEDIDGPIGIAIDNQDVIHVTDSRNERVQKYSLDGVHLGALSGPMGLLDTPYGITIGRNGVIYVSDPGEDRVVAFDSNGTPLRTWGVTGSDSGQLHGPQYLDADSDGNVYVADLLNKRVQKFSATGNYLDAWNDGHRGRFTEFNAAFAVDSNDTVYLADSWYDRFQVFDTGGRFLGEFDESDVGMGDLGTIIDIAASLDGYIYAADLEEDRILKLRRDGTLVSEWSGALSEPVAVAVDQAGDVYVADHDSNRILVYSESGSPLRSWGGPGVGDGQFDGPIDLAIQNGRVYVLDHYNNRVQYFDLDGTYLGQWGKVPSGPGDGDGEFDGPSGIAVDSSGYVFVADMNNHRVQKFTADGEYLTEFGGHGTGTGKFDLPARIEVWNDEVYVLDLGNFRIQIFSQQSGAR